MFVKTFQMVDLIPLYLAHVALGRSAAALGLARLAVRAELVARIAWASVQIDLVCLIEQSAGEAPQIVLYRVSAVEIAQIELA